METKCDRCEGCGKIANTRDAEPWSAWEELPAQSAIAIRMGWVKPIPCPECGGSGLAETVDNSPTVGED